MDLDSFTLAPGKHDTCGDGVNLMEAVAWYAGESHSETPACVSPVLTAFGGALNDNLPDEKRQQLRRFIPLLPGTAGDDMDEDRGYLALDWHVRACTPAWLDAAGLGTEAEALRGLRQINSKETAREGLPTVYAASHATSQAFLTTSTDLPHDIALYYVRRADEPAIHLASEAAIRAAAIGTATDAVTTIANYTSVMASSAAHAVFRITAQTTYKAKHNNSMDAKAAGWDAVDLTASHLRGSAIILLDTLIRPGSTGNSGRPGPRQ